MKDVAIIGAGIAGIATATRLQKKGLSTIVFEAHGQPGGCTGFYRRKGFSFDVGATTLVDFAAGGVGDEWLTSIGMPPVEGEVLPGYIAWLPDYVITLYRDPDMWARERLKTLGDTPAHQAFWRFLDQLAHEHHDLVSQLSGAMGRAITSGLSGPEAGYWRVPGQACPARLSQSCRASASL